MAFIANNIDFIDSKEKYLSALTILQVSLISIKKIIDNSNC